VVRRPQGPKEVDAPPQEFAAVQPRDLHPVADIRLVITDVAKLTERIDNLIVRVGELRTDGKETRDKLDEVKDAVASFKGAMKIVASLYALALVLTGVFFTWYLKQSVLTQAPASQVVAAQSQEAAGQEKGGAEATPVADVNTSKGGD
jgi:hypothetical protein